MRFHTNMGAVATLLFTLVAFQNVDAGPAYARHQGGVPSPPPIVNVKNFGAMGDGIIDDTNAIQNAVNNALSTHRSVFFPPGTYLHAETIVFNGVAVTGSGNASVLLAANNTSNCGVILTGTGPSIQNMVISTAGLSFGNPNIYVYNAASFTIANDTFVQGAGVSAIKMQSSSVGTVSACYFDGTGNNNDGGVIIEQSHNVSVVNSLFQNEDVGVFVDSAQPSQSIALVSNTIGSVSFPIIAAGIKADGVSSLDIAQNTIQMANSSPFIFSISMTGDDQFTVANNNTWGGQVGIFVQNAGPGSNFVTQNTIHNCGIQAIYTANQSFTNIHITGNQFGECGLLASGPSIGNAVILVVGSDPSGATTFVQNNIYQGHSNGLQSKVTCSFTAPHIPAANVTGNTQTQTALSDHI